MFDSTTLLFKQILNSQQMLTKKKKEIVGFLYGFRDYFETKFLCLTDEKVMVNSLSNMLALKSELDDFVYLLFKNLEDKVIQKTLRYYPKMLTESESILNLCSHLLYWKSKNFTKTGSDKEKFSLDYLILKSLEGCLEKCEMDKSILQKLS